METLEIQNLETLVGGERSAFLDGLCVGVTIATFIAPNPVTGSATAGCAIREAYLHWK